MKKFLSKILLSIIITINAQGASSTLHGIAEDSMKYDYIIVGAGSAGSALAGRLLRAEPTPKILLLESGPLNNDTQITHWEESATLRQTKFDYNYSPLIEATLDGRGLQYSEGNVCGGGSSINGMLWAWAHSRDFSDWRRFIGEAPGWDNDHLYELYRSLEHFFRDHDDPLAAALEATMNSRGDEGPVKINLLPYHARSITNFCIQAAATLEHPLPHNPDYVADLRPGISVPQFNAAINPDGTGTRQDAFTCFILNYLEANPTKRAYIDICTRAAVSRILFNEGITVEGAKVKGVQYTYTNESNEDFFYKAFLKEKGEVILSAGAIRSPHLLMLSGIGHSEMLAAKRIETIVHSPGVGKNLQEQMAIPVVHIYNRPQLDETVHPALRGERPLLHQYDSSSLRNTTAVVAFLNPAIAMEGGAGIGATVGGTSLSSGTTAGSTTVPMPLSTTSTDSTASAVTFASTLEDGTRPSLQFQSFFNPAESNTLRKNLFGLNVIQMRPKSRGTIELIDSYYKVPPKINLNPFNDQYNEDLRALSSGLIIARRLMNTLRGADYDHILDEEIDPGRGYMGQDGIREYIRRFAFPYLHPAGTCRMGSRESVSITPVSSKSLRIEYLPAFRPKDTAHEAREHIVERYAPVVDHELKVFGTIGLRIADASIMPTVISANTNATAMLIGAKCAELLNHARMGGGGAHA